MIKVLWQNIKGMFLENIKENIRMPRLNNILNFLFFLILTACSQTPSTQTKEVEWESPPVNPYSSVMKIHKCGYGPPCLLVELKPESLELSCSLRNDSPYYWCYISGLIKKPDPKLPKKVGTVYHRVIHKSKKNVSEQFIDRLKKAKKPVFLFAPTGFFIKNGEFGNALFGIFNEDECIDMFNDFTACSSSSKKLDVFSGKYVN